MAALYHSLFTEKGLELLRESIQNGTKLGITHMSFGDGGGELPIPDASFTQMINEVYRVQLNRLAPSNENPNWLEADGVIPSAVGGFNIREVGLWAGDVMVAYANYPPTYKPSGDQGTAQIKTIRIVLQIDNTANFELKIDASVVMATIQSVEEAKTEAKAFTEEKVKNKVESVESLQDLINLEPYEGMTVSLNSYHPNMNKGGDKFRYTETIDKSKHDGGYIIDPSIPIPPISTFKTYFTATNSGPGVWARVNNKPNVNAVNFGLLDDPEMVWNCAVIKAAQLKAKRLSDGLSTPRKVIIDAGLFLTTDVIEREVLNSRAIPLIGQGRFSTEIRKTTTNVVQPIYQKKNIDAVVFVCPTDVMGPNQVFGEVTMGMTLSRASNINKTGYGYFAYGSPIARRKDISCMGHEFGYWQDDCWMSQVNQIYATTCKKGIAIRGGTSTIGTNIYADRCDEYGIDLYGLTYSSLTVHVDGCGIGTGSITGYPAIDAQFTKGVTLTASCERHRGPEFNIHNSDGLVVNGGRSYGSGDVSSPTAKIVCRDSVFQFNGFSWRYSVSAEQASMYSFIQEIGSNSSYEFNQCQGNSAWNNFPAQVSDVSYLGSFKKSRYSEENGYASSTIKHDNTSFKKLCYVANTPIFKVLSCICTSSDRYYDFGVTPIRKSQISIDQANPTSLTAQQYTNGVADNAQPLQAYIGSDGWLYIKPSASGANYDFKYVIAK